MANQLPIGVHFGLPAEKHHADEALGSTDLRQLAKNPYDWWWQKRMPDWSDESDKPTKAQEYGTALHCLLYDGEQAFDRRYICGPNQKGLSGAQKSASTKAANEAAAKAGREMIPAPAWARIKAARKTITDHPDLKTVFSGGAPEVTIIWERQVFGATDNPEMVRCKARIDYLKAVTRGKFVVAAAGDLKGVSNPRRGDFKLACRWAVEDYEYHAQAAHYLEGMRKIPDAIKANNVWGVVPGDLLLLDRLEAATVFAWQWVFHQSARAPLAHSYSLSQGSPLLAEGRSIIDRGLENYVTQMRKFPAGEWLMFERAEELAIEEMPGWRPGRR